MGDWTVDDIPDLCGRVAVVRSPQLTTASSAAYDAAAASELWDRSEAATGIRYAF
jgi:hypothetical protein